MLKTDQPSNKIHRHVYRYKLRLNITNVRIYLVADLQSVQQPESSFIKLP